MCMSCRHEMEISLCYSVTEGLDVTHTPFQLIHDIGLFSGGLMKTMINFKEYFTIPRCACYTYPLAIQ